MSDERSDLYEAGLKTRREVLGSGWVDPQMEKAKTDPFTAAIVGAGKRSRSLRLCCPRRAKVSA